MTSTFAASPIYAWTVESGTISVDGSLTRTSDETGFGLRDGAVEIRHRQVSGSSPLAGSNRINNLQKCAAGRIPAVSTPCPAVSAFRLGHTPGQAAGKPSVQAQHQARTGCFG